jgi:hypothetical protein
MRSPADANEHLHRTQGAFLSLLNWRTPPTTSSKKTLQISWRASSNWGSASKSGGNALRLAAYSLAAAVGFDEVRNPFMRTSFRTLSSNAIFPYMSSLRDTILSPVGVQLRSQVRRGTSRTMSPLMTSVHREIAISRKRCNSNERTDSRRYFKFFFNVTKSCEMSL